MLGILAGYWGQHTFAETNTMTNIIQIQPQILVVYTQSVRSLLTESSASFPSPISYKIKLNAIKTHDDIPVLFHCRLQIQSQICIYIYLSAYVSSIYKYTFVDLILYARTLSQLNPRSFFLRLFSCTIVVRVYISIYINVYWQGSEVKSKQNTTIESNTEDKMKSWNLNEMDQKRRKTTETSEIQKMK